MAATRRSSRPVGRPPTPARIAPVRDFTGAAPRFAIEWDVRPAYDFLFSLSPDAGGTDDLPAEDRRWLRDARARLGEVASERLTRVTKDEIAIHLVGFLVDHPELQTASQTVEAMRSAGHVAVLRHLFGDMGDSSGAIDPLV